MKTKLELTRENKALLILLERERELNKLLQEEIDQLKSNAK
jgi:hypothetical protein